MSKEFFDAMIEHCKQARRVPVPFEFVQHDGHFGSSDLSTTWVGYAEAQRPFRPRWLLIENPGGFWIQDVRFGAMSQYVNHFSRGVPAELYSLSDALAMKDSPIEAWKRFEVDSVDALHVGERMQVHAVLPDGLPHPKLPMRGLWIGDEPKFRKWEAELAGTIHEVSMGSHGPVVTIHTRTGDAIRVPIKPADIPFLMNKIGTAVKFTLETGDDR